VEERPAIRAMIEEPDPRRKLELHAPTQPGIQARLGPLYRTVAEAAALGPEDRGYLGRDRGATSARHGRLRSGPGRCEGSAGRPYDRRGTRCGVDDLLTRRVSHAGGRPRVDARALRHVAAWKRSPVPCFLRSRHPPRATEGDTRRTSTVPVGARLARSWGSIYGQYQVVDGLRRELHGIVRDIEDRVADELR
jgi:hypothetical protein